MKFQYFSDLHLEYFSSISSIHKFDIIPQAPNLILAGDIGWYHLPIYKAFLGLMSEKFEKVWLISGNHEYYTKLTYTTYEPKKIIHCPEKKTIEEIDEEIKNIAKSFPNIHYLSNDIVHLNSKIAIYGCTLWSLIPNLSKDLITNEIGDYEYIHEFSVEKSIELHKKSLEKLKEQLDKYPQHKFIVITHHLPTFDLVHEKYSKSPLINAFASNVEISNNPQIIKWICGHTHVPMTLGKFLVNPIGYKGENSQVNFNLTFEIMDE
jgi:hypothetical protein